MHFTHHCLFCGADLGTLWPDKLICRNPNCPQTGISYEHNAESRRHIVIKFNISSNRLIRQNSERPTTLDDDTSGSSASFLLAGNSLAPIINADLHCYYCGEPMRRLEDDKQTVYACDSHHKPRRARLTHSFMANGYHEFNLHY